MSEAATYYIDKTLGLDTRTSTQAQSKSTPWAHLRCMASATSNALAYTPVAGDIFILKGGETWVNADLPCNWNWSGTAASRITVTTDATWYTGGSWTRPKWDAGGVAIAGAKNIFLWFNLSARKYNTFSNIEMTGLYWAGYPAFGACAYIMAAGSSQNTFDQLYIHNWSHQDYADGGRDHCYILQGDTNSPYGDGNVFQNGIIDGSDSYTGGAQSGGGGTGSTGTYAWASVVNSIIHDTPNLLTTIGDVRIEGNLFYNCNISFEIAVHENMLHTLGGPSSGYNVKLSNNVFHDSLAGCETAFMGNPGETVYAWNNVLYNLLGNAPSTTTGVIGGGVAMYWWNNTMVPPAGTNCLSRGHNEITPYVTIEFKNNHCITTATTATNTSNTSSNLSLATGNLVLTTNLAQTPTAATAQGYTAVQSPYTYYPTGGGSTVGAGTNLTANCTTIAGLCNDTTYGVTEGANHTVVLAARTAFSRPGTGAWDIGAYQLTNASPIPVATTNINMVNTTGTSSQLIWTPNAEADLVGYHIYRSLIPGVYGTAPVKTVLAPLTIYHIQESLANTWCYIVKPYNSAGTEGPASAEVCFAFTGFSRAAR